MGDGLYIKDKAVVILCTESFTKDEVEVTTLDSKFGIKWYFK